MKALPITIVIACLLAGQLFAQSPAKKVLVLYENGGHHLAFSKRAMPWLDSVAAARHWQLDYSTTAAVINDSSLQHYQLVLQLDYPPYSWPDAAVKAFESYIRQGKGGWVGLHHATLLGEFDGFPMWNWFSSFMGDIRFKDYIANFATGTVAVEDTRHPVMQGIPAAFTVSNEEWYTYNKSPRPNVHVLARVNEASYNPPSDKKMGDHPVVWTNQHMKARNVYIFMGHSPSHFNNAAYTKLLANALIWAIGEKK
ncbi:hypothetical protein SAMN05444266_103380 [Chitinophaga jiangningensis]|uniref:ThuA-like domain-containing protein n=1 Tax=Chitinophaga jiangningensis TaxID=1419482 RepID=A0A1M7AR88_9BACT|nr:ThuA domain-containing protein [Chitinophaga jiangningensis]SHL45228.1 hypothetical protein SAMN05444266_103380 [Chitinophaga jiangningensis]